MAHPYHHALASVKRWGGKPEDYLPIHQFFDESKACLADLRHRALRHHSEGIFLAEKVFGVTLTNSDGTVVPVRFVGEQHVKEDLGWIPTVKDWLAHLTPQPWMGRSGKLPLSEAELSQPEPNHDDKEPQGASPSEAQAPLETSGAGEPCGGAHYDLPQAS